MDYILTLVKLDYSRSYYNQFHKSSEQEHWFYYHLRCFLENMQFYNSVLSCSILLLQNFSIKENLTPLNPESRGTQETSEHENY